MSLRLKLSNVNSKLKQSCQMHDSNQWILWVYQTKGSIIISGCLIENRKGWNPWDNHIIDTKPKINLCTSDYLERLWKYHWNTTPESKIKILYSVGLFRWEFLPSNSFQLSLQVYVYSTISFTFHSRFAYYAVLPSQIYEKAYCLSRCDSNATWSITVYSQGVT